VFSEKISSALSTLSDNVYRAMTLQEFT